MKNKLLFVGLIASSIIVNAQQNSEKEKTIEGVTITKTKLAKEDPNLLQKDKKEDSGLPNQ